jgi:hypothetical protein
VVAPEEAAKAAGRTNRRVASVAVSPGPYRATSTRWLILHLESPRIRFPITRLSATVSAETIETFH